MNKESKTKEKSGFGLDFGGEKLGNMFNGIGNLIELVSKMQKEGKSEFTHSGEIKGLGSKEMKGVYGFSVKLGGLGGDSPKVETFGNIKKDKGGNAVVDEVREPLVDVFEETNRIVIIVEIPGVDQKNIDINLKDDILELKAEDSNVKYQKEILLPSPVKADSLSSTYKNGVLEITLSKK